MCTSMFGEALFTFAKIWKQPNLTSTRCWSVKVGVCVCVCVCVCAMEYNSEKMKFCNLQHRHIREYYA